MFKKAASFILALLLTFSLAACSSLMDDIVNDPEDTSAPSESGGEDVTPDDPSAPGGEDGPTEPNVEATPEGFTIFPEGEYLPKEFRTSDPLPGYDYIETFRGAAMYGIPGDSCSTDDTFYFVVHTPQIGDYLHYMDKATGISGVLCGKPECPHRDTTCNGYMGDFKEGLSFYDGRIWWFVGGKKGEFWSCAPDGTDHRSELPIDIPGRHDGSWYIHRGTIYRADRLDLVVDGEARQESIVMGYPLDGGEPFTIYDSMDTGYPYVYFYRDKMLLVRYTSVYDAAGERIEGKYDVSYYLYDLNTRTVKTLFSGVTDFTPSWSMASLREDGIYQPVNPEEKYENGERGHRLMYLPWEGGEFTQVAVALLPYGLQDYHGRYYLRFWQNDDGTCALHVITLEGEPLLETSFQNVEIEYEPYWENIGWDEDFYYFVPFAPLGSGKTHIAISADGKTIYTFE